jgi:hypothetical protein
MLPRTPERREDGSNRKCNETWQRRLRSVTEHAWKRSSAVWPMRRGKRLVFREMWMLGQVSCLQLVLELRQDLGGVQLRTVYR